MILIEEVVVTAWLVDLHKAVLVVEHQEGVQ